MPDQYINDTVPQAQHHLSGKYHVALEPAHFIANVQPSKLPFLSCILSFKILRVLSCKQHCHGLLEEERRRIDCEGGGEGGKEGGGGRVGVP